MTVRSLWDKANQPVGGPKKANGSGPHPRLTREDQRNIRLYEEEELERRAEERRVSEGRREADRSPAAAPKSRDSLSDKITLPALLMIAALVSWAFLDLRKDFYAHKEREEQRHYEVLQDLSAIKTDISNLNEVQRSKAEQTDLNSRTLAAIAVKLKIQKETTR